MPEEGVTASHLVTLKVNSSIALEEAISIFDLNLKRMRNQTIRAKAGPAYN